MNNAKKRYKRIYIEITNICNLTCHFCPQTKRNLELMDISLFSAILDEIQPFTDYIYLHVKGEPSIHPKFSEFLDLADLKGFKVNITTNGTLIHKVKDVLLTNKALRQVNISLQSLSGNQFLNKEAYIQELIAFAKEITHKTDVFISLRLWNLTFNPFFNLEQKKNNQLLSIIEKEFNLPYKIEEKVTPGSSVKLAERIFLNQDHQFDWPDLNASELGDKGFCFGLRDHVAILVDGTVVPCCLDGEGVIQLGNIKETPFFEIINSERAIRIYEGFSNRIAVEELCKKCGYRTKMG